MSIIIVDIITRKMEEEIEAEKEREMWIDRYDI